MERMVTFRGKTQNVTDWSEETGINYGTLCARRRKGWTPKKALTTPVTINGRHTEGLAPKEHWSDCVPMKIPAKGHYLIRFVLIHMKKNRITYKQMQRTSGVSYETIRNMRRRGLGLFCNIEALINALEFDLLPVSKGDKRYTDIFGKSGG